MYETFAGGWDKERKKWSFRLGVSHMLVFFVCRLKSLASDIALKLEPGEVQACAWLKRDDLVDILNSVDPERSVVGSDINNR